MILRRLRYFSSHLVKHDLTVEKILNTANIMNHTSSVTLGPSGRLVAIESEIHEPRITKDGVTVIKSIEFEDRLMNAVASLVKKAANSANKFSGDGTTTTTLLTFELLRIAHQRAGFEVNQREFREGLEKGKALVLEFLSEFALKAETEEKLKQVAMVATNGDEELSSLISQAINKSENVKVEKSKKSESTVEYTTGMKITRGIPHEMLVNKIDKIQLNYPIVLVHKNKINHVKEILPAIEKAKKMRKPLVVFAEDISESVCSMLFYNHKKGIVQSCPVRVPQRGSVSSGYLPEIARITQAYLFGDFSEVSLDKISYEHFGKCTSIVVDEFQTTIISNAVSQAQNATIQIGGNSETEILEKYDKAVDALNSTKGARKHGVVPGGGIGYLRAAEMLDLYAKQEVNETHSHALSVLSETLRQPLKTLLRSSQMDYLRETSGWEGFNFKSKKYEDLWESGVIDSSLVSKNCVIDSVSIASMLLSLQLSIVQDTTYKESSYDTYKGKYFL